MPHAFNVSRIEIDASFNIKYDKMELYIGEFNGHWSGVNFKNGAKNCGPTKENLNNLKNKRTKKRLKLKTLLTLTCPIGLPPHTPVAQKNAELCTLIASLIKRLFVRVDWTERLRDDSSATD